jgi:diaminohydroxyphosphoribosylaminopyrimidine deaminase / 5-amino-6-(5-phosphoribosylamino)uracil reductase
MAKNKDAAEAFMQRALELAAQGRYSTHPNPRVGCVIVRRGKIVGEGFHARAGSPHAEVVALEAAGAAAKGADVYVTLEPCNHHGRTPPCTQALIRAGVRRVYAAMPDPNPEVAGGGAKVLEKAGIEVQTGLLQAEAEALNRGFIRRMTTGRPWVTLKLAMSLDGRTATAAGESRWITGDAARADAHRLRADAGAVLTSVETVLADDPELTVRTFEVPRQPGRIVLDTQLRAPPAAKVWTPGARRIAVAVRPSSDRIEALRAQGVEVVLAGTDADRRVNLESALTALGRLEINEVLVECGPVLAGSFLQEGLVDELVLYIAPSLLGDSARGLARLPGLESLARRLQFRFADVRPVGEDLRITAIPTLRHPGESRGPAS